MNKLVTASPTKRKHLFLIIISIGFGIFFIYMLYTHFFNPHKISPEEYAEQIKKIETQQDAFEANNKDKIDEANVPMGDAKSILRGKEIFNTDCWVCHGKLGEGAAGPNLTDDYWLHKGSLNDIYQSIKHGYPDKGMQAWSIKFSPQEIDALTSYIKTLQGTNPPNAKAPQGNLFVDNSNTAANK